MSEETCPSCHAHFFQSCDCTWEEVERAEKSYKALGKTNSNKIEMSYIFKKINEYQLVYGKVYVKFDADYMIISLGEDSQILEKINRKDIDICK